MLQILTIKLNDDPWTSVETPLEPINFDKTWLKNLFFLILHAVTYVYAADKNGKTAEKIYD